MVMFLEQYVNIVAENTDHINPVLGKTQGDFPYFMIFHKM